MPPPGQPAWGMTGQPAPVQGDVSMRMLAEHPCPNCGEPMLASWGTTCGRCKPKMASPMTIMLAAGDVAGMTSMTLGWLAVIKTPDAGQLGALIDLTQPVVVLTRAGGGATPGVVGFNDSFMSSGHAVIRRPASLGQDAAFTIEDRKTPSPSVNGTFVNSRRLGAGEVANLCDGDVVRVGSTELVFRSLWLPPGGYRPT
jgi:hypothetical protein